MTACLSLIAWFPYGFISPLCLRLASSASARAVVRQTRLVAMLPLSMDAVSSNWPLGNITRSILRVFHIPTMPNASPRPCTSQYPRPQVRSTFRWVSGFTRLSSLAFANCSWVTQTTLSFWPPFNFISSWILHDKAPKISLGHHSKVFFAVPPSTKKGLNEWISDEQFSFFNLTSDLGETRSPWRPSWRLQLFPWVTLTTEVELKEIRTFISAFFAAILFQID